MPKAYLRYDLDDPEDLEAYRMAMAGKDALYVLGDLKDKIRSILKYEDQPEKVQEVVERLRSELWENINDHGIGHLL